MDFPSEAFFATLVDAFNADPDGSAAARGWQGDLALVVEREAEPPFIAWARPGDGGIEQFRVLSRVEELEALSPAYEARASLRTWRRLLHRELDPIQAILLRDLRVRGDLQQLVARLRFAGLGQRLLAHVLPQG